MAFKFKMKYTIQRRLLPVGSKRRSGQKIIGPYFIVAHGTGNAGSTAANNVNYYRNSAYQQSSSAHTFIDDRNIIECIPLNEKAWHVRFDVAKDNQLFGRDANDSALGIEMCYGGLINNHEAYDRYVWYIAYICYKYKIDPRTRVVGHYLLDPSRRSDPLDAFKYVNKSMADFLNDVAEEYDECTGRITATDREINAIAQQFKEEDEMAKKYSPSSNAMVLATESVLKKFEAAGENKISGKWRTRLENGTLSNSEAIGLLYVALDRGILGPEAAANEEDKE